MKGFGFSPVCGHVVPLAFAFMIAISLAMAGDSFASLHQREIGHCRGTRLLKGALRRTPSGTLLALTLLLPCTSARLGTAVGRVSSRELYAERQAGPCLL